MAEGSGSDTRSGSRQEECATTFAAVELGRKGPGAFFRASEQSEALATAAAPTVARDEAASGGRGSILEGALLSSAASISAMCLGDDSLVFWASRTEGAVGCADLANGAKLRVWATDAFNVVSVAASGAGAVLVAEDVASLQHLHLRGDRQLLDEEPQGRVRSIGPDGAKTLLSRLVCPVAVAVSPATGALYVVDAERKGARPLHVLSLDGDSVSDAVLGPNPALRCRQRCVLQGIRATCVDIGVLHDERLALLHMHGKLQVFNADTHTLDVQVDSSIKQPCTGGLQVLPRHHFHSASCGEAGPSCGEAGPSCGEAGPSCGEAGPSCGEAGQSLVSVCSARANEWGAHMCVWKLTDRSFDGDGAPLNLGDEVAALTGPLRLHPRPPPANVALLLPTRANEAEVEATGVVDSEEAVVHVETKQGSQGSRWLLLDSAKPRDSIEAFQFVVAEREERPDAQDEPVALKRVAAFFEPPSVNSASNAIKVIIRICARSRHAPRATQKPSSSKARGRLPRKIKLSATATTDPKAKVNTSTSTSTSTSTNSGGKVATLSSDGHILVGVNQTRFRFEGRVLPPSVKGKASGKASGKANGKANGKAEAQNELLLQRWLAADVDARRPSSFVAVGAPCTLKSTCVRGLVMASLADVLASVVVVVVTVLELRKSGKWTSTELCVDSVDDFRRTELERQRRLDVEDGAGGTGDTGDADDTDDTGDGARAVLRRFSLDALPGAHFVDACGAIARDAAWRALRGVVAGGGPEDEGEEKGEHSAAGLAATEFFADLFDGSSQVALLASVDEADDEAETKAILAHASLALRLPMRERRPGDIDGSRAWAQQPSEARLVSAEPPRSRGQPQGYRPSVPVRRRPTSSSSPRVRALAGQSKRSFDVAELQWAREVLLAKAAPAGTASIAHSAADDQLGRPQRPQRLQRLQPAARAALKAVFRPLDELRRGWLEGAAISNLLLRSVPGAKRFLEDGVGRSVAGVVATHPETLVLFFDDFAAFVASLAVEAPQLAMAMISRCPLIHLNLTRCETAPADGHSHSHSHRGAVAAATGALAPYDAAMAYKPAPADQELPRVHETHLFWRHVCRRRP